MKASIVGLVVVAISIAIVFGVITLQDNVDSSENILELTNKNSEYEINYNLLHWDRIVDDAKYAYDGSKELNKMAFRVPDAELSTRYNSELNEFSPIALFDFISTGVWMYKITGDEVYLNHARNTASTLEKHFLTDDNVLLYLNPRDGKLIDGSNTNQEVLNDVSYLALLDPNYDVLVKKMADGILKNEINHKTNLFYTYVDNFGRPITTDMYLPYRGAYGMESLLLAYEITSDEKYLKQVKNTILVYWDQRNKETNLIPSMVNAVDKEVKQEFMQQYGAGIFLKLLLHYYYLTDDPEILSIMKIYSDAVMDYFWDGKTWNYRVNYDGTVLSPSIEANFGKLDDVLFLLHDLDPILFANTYSYAKSDYDNSLKNDLILEDSLVIHSVKDDGSRDSPQSMMVYAFTINQNIGTRLYHDTLEVNYLQVLHEFYDSMITNHKRVYGYVHGIDAYSKEITDLGPILNQRSPSIIANKIILSFIPSENVEIIWTIIGNHELSEPFITGFHDAGRFNNIEFDYKNRSIDMKIVYGKGTITFADEIEYVLADGVEYEDFNNYTLNTLDGKHRYHVFLAN